MLYFIIFKFVFILREREKERERERERENPKKVSCAVSTEPEAEFYLTNREIMTEPKLRVGRLIN